MRRPLVRASQQTATAGSAQAGFVRWQPAPVRISHRHRLYCFGALQISRADNGHLTPARMALPFNPVQPETAGRCSTLGLRRIDGLSWKHLPLTPPRPPLISFLHQTVEARGCC